MPLYKSAFLFLMIFLLASFNYAAEPLKEDTLSRNLETEQKLFLQNSYILLAAKFGVNAADAAVIQSRLYPNPNFSIGQGAYNKYNEKWFDVSRNGESELSLQQLIILGGKRKKQINIARLNSKYQNNEFYDLVRNLSYELNTSFYQLYFQQQSINVYNNEINSLNILINTYREQYQKGNISFKELARIQSEQFALQNERLDLVNETNDIQNRLKLLTADSSTSYLNPVVDTSAFNNIHVDALNISQLIDSGIANRSDLQASINQLEISKANLSLQKSLVVPDINLGFNYDRQGSYIRDYNSVSLAFDLPFWNRNQGNIKLSQAQIKQNTELADLTRQQVEGEIIKSYSQFTEIQDLYNQSKNQFNGDYEKMLDGISLSYRNHMISLLEFIDYYETYKNSKIEFNRLRSGLINSYENLKLVTETNF